MKQILALLFLLLLSGCSSKYSHISSKPSYQCLVNSSLAPKWICHEYQIDGYISAVISEANYSKVDGALKQVKAKAKKELLLKADRLHVSIAEPKVLKWWVEPVSKESYFLYIAPQL